MYRNNKQQGFVTSLLTGMGIDVRITPLIISAVVGSVLTIFLKFVLTRYASLISNDPISISVFSGLHANAEKWVWLPMLMIMTIGLINSISVCMRGR